MLLQNDYRFLKLYENSTGNIQCLIGNSEFTLERKRRLGTEEHLISGKHNKAVSVASSSSITNYSKNKVERDSQLQCAAKNGNICLSYC